MEFEDFKEFFEKHTKDATVFIFDGENNKLDGFMICDARYQIIYKSKTEEERNNFIDFLNSKQINYVIIYGNKLPTPDLVFQTMTI